MTSNNAKLDQEPLTQTELPAADELPLCVQDYDDPSRIREISWMAGIASWFDGDSSRLEVLVRTDLQPLPQDAREFFADLVAGRLEPNKGGRPIERDGWVERTIVAEVFREWERLLLLPRSQRGGSPKDVAMALVGERRSTRQEQIRGVVNKLATAGITKAFWVKVGRPDWTRR